MKLLLGCLFAVTWCFAISTSAKHEVTIGRLQELLDYVKKVETNVKSSDLLINTPPQDIEDCCSLAALECFRENLMHINVSDVKYIRKLSRGLKGNITKSSMNICKNETTSTCQACNTHPKQSAKDFLKRLESLIQWAITQRSN